MDRSSNRQTSGSPRLQLQQWYRNSVVGRRLREQIAADMRVILEEWFGYHMVIIGADPGIDVSSFTRVQTITRILPEQHESSHAERQMIALDEELPIATESIDVVVLVNALELTEHPHQLLREVQRVLTPHGHLLLVGSNGLSIRGIGRYLTAAVGWRNRRKAQGPSVSKLEDWLALLDFSVAPVRHKLVLPFGGRGRVGRWFARIDDWLVDHNIPPGSAYVVYAHKMVRGHIQGLPVQRIRARLMGLPVAKPVVGARGSASRSQRNHIRSVD